jgi:hypothetical protein
MADRKFTVCALLYGNYPDLARRCLEPVFELCGSGRVDLRIGMNEVSEETRDYVADSAPSDAEVISADPQILKYPMMRRLFYDKPVSTDYVMWFDDDSYVKADNFADWLDSVEEAMASCDMLGSVYTIAYTPSQKQWCAKQPWYAGKSIPDRPQFATGGWWCIKTQVLNTFGWPISELQHCGGDVALGVLLHQHGLRLRHFREGVAINANSEGKESAAERRGASKTAKPIGKL